jgi:Ni,Fe-hydrogenase III small subunit
MNTTEAALATMARTTSTEYWNDSCSVAELEYAVANGAVGATSNPTIVAVGACAISGGVFAGTYAGRDGIGEVLPVDVVVPGCPPRPEALIHGRLVAVGRMAPFKSGALRGADDTAAGTRK